MEFLVCYNYFKIMQLLNKSFSILFIYFTYNNIICTFATNKGQTLVWSTAGLSKTKGVKKITASSINAIINLLYNYNKKSKSIYIKVKGINKNKNYFLKRLKVVGFNILAIQEKLNMAYNGCKKLRKRRV